VLKTKHNLDSFHIEGLSMNAVVKTAAIPFLKKITPKTVYAAANPGKDILELGNSRPVPAQVLYDVFGQINGYKQKADDKNEKGIWTQFKGRFRAVVMDTSTGEARQWESGAMHVPVLEDMILAAFQTAKDQDPRAHIEIALRVGIVPANPLKPSATGYEYDVQRLIPQEDTAQDPIVALMQAAAKANPPKLAAPVVEDKAADPQPASGTASVPAGQSETHHKRK
jgi:hypothetical protein